jgi:HEAT repeat protein
LIDEFQKNDPVGNEVAGSAGLALGSSIAFDGDPATIGYVKGLWKDSKPGFFTKEYEDPVLRQDYVLKVMGNSKSDAFLPEVKDALSSSNPLMREAAVNALRFSQDRESKELLHKSLKSDSSPGVRAIAAKSMLYQPLEISLFQDLSQCASSETHTGVRAECIRVLSTRVDQPAVRQFLEGRSGSENDPQLKAMIDASLNLEKGK